MGYAIREVQCKGPVIRVDVVETYADESGQQQERLVEKIGFARSELGLSTKRFLAKHWIDNYAVPDDELADAPITPENIFDIAAAELLRTYESKQGRTSFSGDEARFWYTTARLRVAAPELVNWFFQQHGLNDLFGNQDRETAKTLRDEVAHQVVEIGRSDQELDREREGSTYFHGRTPSLKRMLRRLTAKRIAQLPERLTAAASSTLGGPVTEACLMFGTRRCLFTEGEVEEWYEDRFYGNDDGPLRSQRVALAVLVTPSGLPLDCWTLNAPVLTVKALRPILSKVRRRHGDLHVAVAGGDTLMKVDTLDAIAPDGFGHLMTAELRELPPALAEPLADLGTHPPPDGTNARHLEQWHGDRRLLAHRTHVRRLHDKRSRERRFAQAEHMMETGRFRANPYIVIDPERGAQLRPDLFEYDARLDGVRAVWTDLREAAATDLIDRTTELGSFATYFRFDPFDPKADSEDYWTPPRVAAHAAISLCALAVMRSAVHHLRQHDGLPEWFNVRHLQGHLSDMHKHQLSLRL